MFHMHIAGLVVCKFVQAHLRVGTPDVLLRMVWTVDRIEGCGERLLALRGEAGVAASLR